MFGVKISIISYEKLAEGQADGYEVIRETEGTFPTFEEVRELYVNLVEELAKR